MPIHFLHSRAEQLADYIREQISSGKLVEPLPGTREWGMELGVARGTLERALGILSAEGLIIVRPRSRLRLGKVRSAFLSRGRVVRILYYAHDFPRSHNALGWIAPLSDRLHFHQIELVVEKCTGARFREIANRGRRSDELLILFSLSARHQALFARAALPVVCVPTVAPGLALPFLGVDQVGTVQHAAMTLLRGGHTKLCLVLPRSTSAGFQPMVAAFQATCEAWPHQPVSFEVVTMSLEMIPLLAAAKRFAARLVPRQGILLSDVPIGMIMTALLQRGLRVPEQIEIIELLGDIETIKVCPPPKHYPFPVAKTVKAMTDLAGGFFRTGSVPSKGKTLTVEMVDHLRPL